jgi:hypothetical protein
MFLIWGDWERNRKEREGAAKKLNREKERNQL